MQNRRGTLTIIACIALVATAGTATAAAFVDPPHGEATISASAADAIDVRLVAADTGWSVDVARAHMAVQATFGDLLTKLAARYTGTFMSGALTRQPGAPSLVRFKGAVPSGVARDVAAAGIPVEVIANGGYSAAELQQRAIAVRNQLVASGFPRVVTAVRADGSIETTVDAPPGTAPPVLPPGLRNRVSVSVATGPISQAFHARGGALVTGSTSCTSGFAVTSFAGVDGISDAGHCTGITVYNPPEGGASYALTHQAEHRGVFGDVEWKTSDHLEPAEYWARSTELRSVTAVEPYAAIAENNSYCFYGRFSNFRQCDQVHSTFVDATFDGVYTSSLVSMDENNAISGDSGGPWSFGTEATGSTVGAVWNWFAWRDVFSVADLFPLALAVTVKT